MMEEELLASQSKRSWFQFSVRTLLFLMTLVCVYLAGHFGKGFSDPSQLEGTWNATLPLGHERDVKLTYLEENRFLLLSRGSVFDGIYLREGDRLVVKEPEDMRMKGLVWKWQGERMTLISEPAGNPTGSSYLGTTLVRAVEEKTEGS